MKSAMPAYINVAVTVLALLVIALFGVRTIATTSWWTNLSAGRVMNAEGGVLRTNELTFAQQGEDAVFSSWMYDRIMHHVWETAGAAGVTLLHVAFVVAAFLVLMPLARRWADYPAIALSLLLCGWMISFVFKLSPSLLVIIFPAIFIRLLHSKTRPSALWFVLPACQALWTNMSGTYLIGPALVLAMGIQVFFSKSKKSKGPYSPTAYLGLAGACLLATLINPYGLNLHRHTLALWNEPALGYVGVWISQYAAHFRNNIPSLLLVITLIVCAIGLITYRSNLPTMLTIVVGILVFMSVRSLRYLDMLAVLAFPFICLTMQATLNTLTSLVLPQKRLMPAASAYAYVSLAILISILSIRAITSNGYYSRVGSSSRFGLGIELSDVPVEAAGVMATPGFSKRILNMPSDGGYLSWALPQHKVFIDERAVQYGANTYSQVSAALMGDDDAWTAIVEAYEMDAIIVSCSNNGGGIIFQNINSKTDWSLVFFDGISAIFLRNSHVYGDFLDMQEVRNKGLRILEEDFESYKAKVSRGGRAPNSSRLIGAGNVFYATGRLTNARTIFDTITVGSPNMTGAWLISGLTRVRMGQDIERAIVALERTVSLNSNMALAWMWLSVCYEHVGETGRALTAYERGLEIDPELSASFTRPGRRR